MLRQETCAAVWYVRGKEVGLWHMVWMACGVLRNMEMPVAYRPTMLWQALEAA